MRAGNKGRLCGRRSEDLRKNAENDVPIGNNTKYEKPG